MVRYAITDGSAHLPGGSTQLLANAHRWANEGIDFVQLREKALEAGALQELAAAIAAILHQPGSSTKLLINSRPDIAIAAQADGVHLTALPGELSPTQVRHIFAAANLPTPTVSVACHTLAEVSRAAANQADLILFGPVFEKRIDGTVVVNGVGPELLQMACTAAGNTPLLALGGINPANTTLCLQTGASGIAGIRLFA